MPQNVLSTIYVILFDEMLQYTFETKQICKIYVHLWGYWIKFQN